MKKILLFFFILGAFSISVKSQNEQSFQPGSSQSKLDQDRKLAATIKRLTNRSTEGLSRKKLRGGGFMIDLQGRFQNVMLAKLDASDEPAAACVTGLDEANEFFGKNLETGDLISSARFEKDNSSAITSQYGMTEQEFNFYKNLIEDAAIHRAQSPNSATITIVNADGAGEGFNDATAKAAEGGNNGATLGEQRLNLFNYAASIWGAYLDTSVTVKVSSSFDPLTPCSTSGGVLGSAGTTGGYINFTNAPYPNTIYHAALANKISGTDQNGATAEINAQFNSSVDSGCLGAGTRFYYGLDNSTPSGRVNLLVVLLHEMGHGLGFSSFVNGSTGALASGYADIYTRFMYDNSTGKYWYQMTNAERQASALNNGNVFWDGANVKIASSYLTAGRDSSGRVLLFTPTTLQSGSSISHWDTSAFANLLMEPVINSGLPTTLDLTRQQMRDIGWFRDSNADGSADTITNVQTGNAIYIFTPTTVTWTNNGGFSRNVTIELSTDGGLNYTSTIAANVSNTGSYTFTVPNYPTNQARIRVREADFAAPQGFSSSNFKVQYAPTAAPVSVAGRVTDPNGRGIGRAKISAVRSDGSVISTLSDLDGSYNLDGMEAGETVVFQISHKYFAFAPQVVSVRDDLTNFNFVGQAVLKKGETK